MWPSLSIAPTVTHNTKASRFITKPYSAVPLLLNSDILHFPHFFLAETTHMYSISNS